MRVIAHGVCANAQYGTRDAVRNRPLSLLAPCGVDVAVAQCTEATSCHKRTLESVIEALLTDENLRIRFALDRIETVAELCLRGVELTSDEVDLFCRTDARLWFLGDEVTDEWQQWTGTRHAACPEWPTPDQAHRRSHPGATDGRNYHAARAARARRRKHDRYEGGHMNRYIGWALLTAFFLGIHLSADEAITITARPSGDPGERIRAAESDRRAERHEPHADMGSRRPGVLPEQHDAARGLVGCAKLFLHGERSPRGHFDVRARLVRSDNTEVMAQTRIIVGGGDGLDE